MPNPHGSAGVETGPQASRRGLLLAAAASVLPAATQAQAAWPSRPVRVIVPFPPGGLTDGYARAYSDHLSRKFGQAFVVENKTGAGGTLGVAEVAKAAADGHTLLVTTSSAVCCGRLPPPASRAAPSCPMGPPLPSRA